MATVHITVAEAERDFASLLARVRTGVEVVIEVTESSAIVLRMVEESPLRKLSESLRLAKEHGSTTTLDGEFGRDLGAIIESRSAPLKNLWD